MTDEERRAADQDAAVEQAFVAGTLPEADRRDRPDAGSGLYRDNATTPHVKTGQDIPPNQDVTP